MASIGKVENSNNKIRSVNFRLIIAVLISSVIGVLVVHSATANEVTNSVVSTTVKQIIGVAGGIVIMVILMLIDYHKLVKYSFLFYIFAIGFLVYLLVFTQPISGAKRWIYFRGFGTIQPSEFAKPALLMFMAFFVHKFEDRISHVLSVLIFIACAAPILALVLSEPDLSTAIVIIVTLISVLFLSGISYKWVLGVILAILPFIIVFIIAVYQPGQGILHALLKPHQVERINGYFFPDDFPNVVYQQRNSVMAIGSGGFFGKGLNNSSLESVKNGSFLSEEQCDFIFAVIGEELGFVGAFAVIALIGVITFECFRIARQCTDTVGKVIAGTSGSILFVQSFINIGVATLVLPNTGIPLPFFSAGLSSLLSSFILIGLVLSVAHQIRLEGQAEPFVCKLENGSWRSFEHEFTLPEGLRDWSLEFKADGGELELKERSL